MKAAKVSIYNRKLTPMDGIQGVVNWITPLLLCKTSMSSSVEKIADTKSEPTDIRFLNLFLCNINDMKSTMAVPMKGAAHTALTAISFKLILYNSWESACE